MTKDRLPMLRKQLQARGFDQDDWMLTLEDSCNNAKLTEDTNHFLHMSCTLQSGLEDIGTLTRDLSEQHSLVVTETSSSSDTSKSIATIETKLKGKITIAKEQLKNLEDEFAVQEKFLPGPETRMQHAQIAALSRTFQQRLSDYNSVLLSYREQCKRRLHRQLDISGHSKTDEEIEQMIEQGQLTAVSSAQLSIEFQDAKQNLQHVKERHQEIIQLEKSILELYDLFAEMALQVSQQNDLLDHIEFNVQAAADELHDALPNLRKAHRYRTSTNPLIKLLGCYGAVRFCNIL